MKTARDWKTFLRPRARTPRRTQGLRACLDRADALGLPERLRGARRDRVSAYAPGNLRRTRRGGGARGGALAVRDGAGAWGVAWRERSRTTPRSCADARAGDDASACPRCAGYTALGCAGRRWPLGGRIFARWLLRACSTRRRVGRNRPAPRIVRRFPFLTEGDEPADLPGMDELLALRAVPGGVFLVATADPIHRGVGYDTPPAELRPRDDPASAGVGASMRAGRLSTCSPCAGLSRIPEPRRHGTKSDFRDPGPVLAHSTRR